MRSAEIKIRGRSSLRTRLRGFTAAPPVWGGSTDKPIEFEPMSKREAIKLWHRARDFERQTRRPGKQDGAIGRSGLMVLHSLIFDFRNHASGALYPSYEAIAKKAGVSVRSVARGLAALKGTGVLTWARRCHRSWEDGRLVLRQLTNAYTLLPTTRWRGYVAPLPAPPPAPGTWGDHPPWCSLRENERARTEGAPLTERVPILMSDPTDRLAMALGRLGAAVARNATLTGVPT